jgi:hypothetical protein
MLSNVLVSLPDAQSSELVLLGMGLLGLSLVFALSGNGFSAVVVGFGALYLLTADSDAPGPEERYAAVRTAVTEQLGVQFAGDQNDEIDSIVGRSNSQTDFGNGHLALLVNGTAADCLVSVTGNDGANYRLLVICGDQPLPRVDGALLTSTPEATAPENSTAPPAPASGPATPSTSAVPTVTVEPTAPTPTP